MLMRKFTMLLRLLRLLACRSNLFASSSHDFDSAFAELAQTQASGLVVADDDFFSAQAPLSAPWPHATA
jgi:hypothetical protein